MGLETTASLVVAALDLKLVQLLRQAIRTADQSSGAARVGEAHFSGPGTSLHAAPHIEPRQRIHPTPRFEPRPVIHPTPRVDLTISQISPPASDPLSPPKRNNSIEPPWKTVVWQIPTPPPAQVKVIIHRTDVAHKGSLIDLFI